jgi:dCTP diphosphatase
VADGDRPDKAKVSDEVADVLIYALRFADIAGIDVAAAVADKIARNEHRFPKLAQEDR